MGTSPRTQHDLIFIADQSAEDAHLEKTIDKLVENLDPSRAFVDLSSPAGRTVAAVLVGRQVPFDIPDVEANSDHLQLADSADRIVPMPEPGDLVQRHDSFVVILGNEQVDADAQPHLVETSRSPVSTMTKIVAEAMVSNPDIQLRMIMPLAMGFRVDSQGDPAYRIVNTVEVNTEHEV